jgi:predicted ATP-dependent endonuclease of OLD family
MHIQFVEISNFRKLLSVRVDFAEQTTLLVGANNSGKTSAMRALRCFLVDGGKFTAHDLTLFHWNTINEIGMKWEALLAANDGSLPSMNDWTEVLPTLDVWLHVEKHEIHYVRSILPTLAWEPGRIGVRLRFEPKDISQFFTEFTSAVASATETKAAAKPGKSKEVKLWPLNMIDFLGRGLSKHFAIRGYVLDPAKIAPPERGIAKPQVLPASAFATETNPLTGLIKIHEINAQRGFGQSSDSGETNSEAKGFSAGRKESRRLSDQLRTYYEKHLDPFDKPDPSDLDALAAIEEAQRAFDERLDDCFAAALEEVAGLGYPGVSDPKLKIITRIRPTDGMNHEAAVQYEISMMPGETGHAPLRLPEDSNGLGYQNLVSMVFQLMSFRDAWMRVGKAGKDRKGDESFQLEPLHLVLIEEPEAHLHAQVQQVFIRKAYNILRGHADLDEDMGLRTQLVVSTHSSHVAHETEFANLRYFRRLPASVARSVPVSAVVNVSEVFGPADQTANFATRYLRAAHCDLFFADAAILVEGPAERMLVPHFIRNHFGDLNQCYLTLLEIGGAHAHRLEPLLRHLGLPTLVITDLDSEANGGGATVPTRRAEQTTNNTTLKDLVPKATRIDELLDLESEKKVLPFDDMSAVRVAYQTPIKVQLKGKSEEEALPYTFEDALVFSNIEIFQGLDGTGLVRKFRDAITESDNAAALGKSMFESLKRGKKAEFALDVLALEDPKRLAVPLYIVEGLEWLQRQLKMRQLDVLQPEAAPEATK